MPDLSWFRLAHTTTNLSSFTTILKKRSIVIERSGHASLFMRFQYMLENISHIDSGLTLLLTLTNPES